MDSFYDSLVYPAFMINWSTTGLQQVRAEGVGRPQPALDSPGTELPHTAGTVCCAAAGDSPRKKE